MNYDPNLVCCGQMAEQTVKITLGMWDYRAEKETVVYGNCLGMCIIEAAVESVYNALPSDKYGAKEILLKNDDGKELLCTDDEDEEEDWLKQMVVKVEIIAIEKISGSKK